MITVGKASRKSIQALSRKLLRLLEDPQSQIYRENVTKFGIPDEYVKKAFNEETLLKAFNSGNSTFYLALENSCKILGFAQIIQKDANTAELDRIVVFPQFTRKGIGTRLLEKVLKDQQNKVKTIIVNAGKEETHARKFYEKNGFKQIREITVDAPWGKKFDLVVYSFELKS